MASIDVSEIVDLIKVDDEYRHGRAQAVLRVMGIPVLYAQRDVLYHEGQTELVENFEQRFAKVMAKLLLAEGGLEEWSETPVSTDPPF
jgi:hypothetical protein